MLRPIKNALVSSPLIWCFALLSLLLFQLQQLPAIHFNISEILLGKSLFKGWGYIFGPLDPPGLSRPILGAIFCGVWGLFLRHPTDIYHFHVVFTLSVFLISLFYLFKDMFDNKSGHLACFLFFLIPTFASYPVRAGQFVSHLTLLSVMGWAIFWTWKYLKAQSSKNAFFLGLFWALSFLARYEVLLCFLVLFFCLLFLKRKTLWISLFVFLPFFVGKEGYYRNAAAKYAIVADNAIYTFYTGEVHSRNRQITANGDNLGYAESHKLYGPISENKGSLLVLISRFPKEVFQRFFRNLQTAMKDLFNSAQFFTNLHLLFLLGIFFLLKSEKKMFLLLLALSASSLSVLLFHIDARYLMPLSVFLFILMGMGLCGFLRRMESTTFKTKQALAIIIVTFSTYFLFLVPYRMPLTTDHKIPGEEFVKVGKILSGMNLSSPPVLYAEIPGEDPFLLQPTVSFFADTAIAWNFTGEFPLDKMAALSRKTPEFLLTDRIQDNAIAAIDSLKWNKLYLYDLRGKKTFLSKQ